MKAGEPSDLERELHRHHQLGAIDRAAELAIRGYGDEIRRWLLALTHDRGAATDIYSAACEDIWKGLQGFRWESSFRTWAYCVARNAWRRHLRTTERSREVEVPLDDVAVGDLAQEERSETEPWLRTEVRDGFARIHGLLGPADRMLLALRVERRMTWEEIARILTAEGEEVSERAIQRKATALRQQFKRLKARMRALAAREGLLEAA